mgnify:CR=1 FL=1
MKKVSVVPDFYILGVNVEDLPEPKKVAVISEVCDCYDKYGGIMHINGGNYHSEIIVYEIPDTSYYLLKYGNTRETFEGDEYNGIIILINGKPAYGLLIRNDESYALYHKKKARKILKSYEEDENYYVVYHNED